MEDKRKMALYQNIKSVDANKFHLSLRCISQQWKLRGGKKIPSLGKRTVQLVVLTNIQKARVNTQECILQGVLDWKAAAGMC